MLQCSQNLSFLSFYLHNLECYCSPLLTHTVLHSPSDDIIVFLASTYIGISLNFIRQSCTQLPRQMSSYLSWLRHTKHAHHWANSFQSYHIRFLCWHSHEKRSGFSDFSMWKTGLSLPMFRSGYSDLLQGEDEASMNTCHYVNWQFQWQHLMGCKAK